MITLAYTPSPKQQLLSSSSPLLLLSTTRARECLGAWFAKYKFKMMLDAACGDANWQAQIPGIKGRFVGADLSKVALQRAAQ